MGEAIPKGKNSDLEYTLDNCWKTMACLLNVSAGIWKFRSSDLEKTVPLRSAASSAGWMRSCCALVPRAAEFPEFAGKSQILVCHFEKAS
ncbi:hypothetical protein [Geothrix sp. 21YS21S-2]|uniref:hypothetical protein n=1 Tax=Geothrix sp. 21YS21S-2 TaxID=3068893 RepID=UPI0027B9237C|nr:hypothetical protein [Geothrix sp. 21YS21S-2]